MLEDVPWDIVSADAFDAAFLFANFPGFTHCFEGLKHLGVNTHTAVFPPGHSTIYHLAARSNAVHTFKYLLVQSFEKVINENGDQVPVADSVPGKPNNRTFLHWAARSSSKEVIRFSVRNFGNLGFNAIDCVNLNPAHYGYIHGSSYRTLSQCLCEVATITQPFYGYMLKRTDIEYDLAFDPDVDEHPDE
jgi:hypothetical protein